jgi:phosphoribosylformylglycinamidine (FGAM) synthase-like amidotransferase family enzyme
MTNKFLLWGGALTLSTVAFAGSKAYDVILPAAANAGSVQLAPGQYKLKVEGSNAIFTGAQTGKSVSVPVKVDNGATKYSSTSLDTTTQSGAVKITSIELGGSKTKLEFGR